MVEEWKKQQAQKAQATSADDAAVATVTADITTAEEQAGFSALVTVCYAPPRYLA